jgi:hypothetical protein
MTAERDPIVDVKRDATEQVERAQKGKGRRQTDGDKKAAKRATTCLFGVKKTANVLLSPPLLPSSLLKHDHRLLTPSRHHHDHLHPCH